MTAKRKHGVILAQACFLFVLSLFSKTDTQVSVQHYFDRTERLRLSKSMKEHKKFGDSLKWYLSQQTCQIQSKHKRSNQIAEVSGQKLRLWWWKLQDLG